MKLEEIKVVLFDENALKKLHKKSLVAQIIAFVVFCAVLAFPTENFLINVYLRNFGIIAGIIFLAQLASFAAIKTLNKNSKFANYFSINVPLAVMSLVVLAPAGIISYLISSTALKTSVIMLVFSLVPFYHFVFFGWCNEELSGLKKFKGILIATVSMIIYFFANYLIGFLTA
ncbi:MAG TPA: hypothetical protein VI894_03795 [Candidatus Nanoarchaeia archaeon]|nr:hypothetical protein [Candidatus Nanoarchaeia archaeon]